MEMLVNSVSFTLKTFKWSPENKPFYSWSSPGPNEDIKGEKNKVITHAQYKLLLVSNDRERFRDFWKNTTARKKSHNLAWSCAISNIFYCTPEMILPFFFADFFLIFPFDFRSPPIKILWRSFRATWRKAEIKTHFFVLWLTKNPLSLMGEDVARFLSKGQSPCRPLQPPYNCQRHAGQSSKCFFWQIFIAFPIGHCIGKVLETIGSLWPFLVWVIRNGRHFDRSTFLHIF